MTTNQKGAGSSLFERMRNPSDRGCAMLHSTIHFPSTKIGIGRGLELLPEDGCLRGERASGATGYTRWKGERSVAFLNKKKTKHSDKKRIARALARSSCRAEVRRVAFFPTEVGVPWGSASQVCFSHISLGVEERFNAQTIRSSATR